jgi:two-component system, chemotaxis family, sensor kinase CheA
MNDDVAEFLDLFRDEANGRLDSMVDALLALESGRASSDAVDGLFRNAHTIKGGAGMLGLDDVRTLAHAVEDVLEDVRDRGEFPVGLADTLLRAVDVLRRELAGDAEGAPDLIEELAQRRPGRGDTGREERSVLTEEPATPLERRTIRVPAEKIDLLLDLVGESVLHRRRLEHVLGEELARRDEGVLDELDQGERLLDDLKEAAIGMRTLPLSSITGPMPRAVRDLALAAGKQAELVIAGGDTELDRVILESLSEPLVHLLRNAVAHGIEDADERVAAHKDPVGKIALRAEQQGGSVAIVVADDGRGVSRNTLTEARRIGSLTDVLTRPGFSTAEEVSELSGRGVGLDVVKRHVESFGGTLEVRSKPGKSTEVAMLLPLTLALLEVLLVERGGNVFGIPLANIEEAVSVTADGSSEDRPPLEIRGRSLPLADLADVIGAAGDALPERASAVVVSAGGRQVALLCDMLLGEDEVVVKPLGSLLAGIPGYLGGAILGDGRVGLLLDPATLVRTSATPVDRRSRPEPPLRSAAPKVLVVEDSPTVRELERSILESAGYRVETAHDGREGLERFVTDHEIELVLTDLELPELDGFELTRAIRADDRRGKTPVVVLTSQASPAARRRGKAAGASAFLTKRSFDQRKLLETVRRLLGR